MRKLCYSSEFTYRSSFIGVLNYAPCYFQKKGQILIGLKDSDCSNLKSIWQILWDVCLVNSLEWLKCLSMPYHREFNLTNVSQLKDLIFPQHRGKGNSLMDCFVLGHLSVHGEVGLVSEELARWGYQHGWEFEFHLSCICSSPQLPSSLAVYLWI